MLIMKKVLIMMAVYNGSQYIRKQIESILGQTNQQWHLVCQDDGSTDNTWEILEEYADRDSRIEIIKNEECYHGVCYNFHILINKCKKYTNDYDLFAFCDQDDIWFKNKLETFEKAFSKNDIPQLCYADMQLIDGSGAVTGDSFYSTIKRKYKGKYGIVFTNIVYGCNCMMNQKLFSLVPMVDIKKQYCKYLIHDALYGRAAAYLGEIHFLPTATMQYRRHQSNVSGREQKKDILGYIKRFFNLNSLAYDYCDGYNQSLAAIHIVRPVATNTSLLNKYEKLIRKGGISLYIATKEMVAWGDIKTEIGRFLVIVFGLHKKYLLKESDL